MMESSKLQSSIQENNNIIVAVRVRPFSDSESRKKTKNIVKVLDENVLILLDPMPDNLNLESPYTRSKEKQYAFDVVLTEQASQTEVFNKTTKFLIEGVVNGYNASVFAYGPTGAGKTYTMIGENEKPGVMFNTFLSLFSEIEGHSRDRQYKVSLSYLEIYNEIIRDLLNPLKEGLEIREDPQKGMLVNGLTEILASSPDAVLRIINNGNKKRTCEATKANQTSSRSHAILQIIVESRDKASGLDSEILIGKLSLIDLAGSERAANTQNRGIRLIEGANINRSLLSLGNCINSLCEMNEKGGKIYIPYRDSKLTRLLKDSLGGNCRTVMITCVSPSSLAYDDTYNTLIYANRAKNIKTKVERNSLNVQTHITKYTTLINQLKQEVLDLRAELGNSVPSKNIENYLIEISRHFQDEARVRKNIYLNVQKNDNIGFTLFSKQTELIEISVEKGENSSAYKKLKEEIEDLRKSVMGLENEIENQRNRLSELESKREEIELNWQIAGIREPNISQLALEMKKHSLMMSSLDSQNKESHNKIIIEQKDMYIKLLEEQLKLRDSLMGTDLPNIDDRTLKKIKSFDQINSHFASVHSISQSPTKKSSINLPAIIKTRIPRPKALQMTPKVEETKLRKNKQTSESKYSKKYKSRNRASSLESRSSDNSAASTLAEQKKVFNFISEKYSSSPYVKHSIRSRAASKKVLNVKSFN